MLHLHHSDELEPLLDALSNVLESAPADPFASDVVVVPTAGLADAAKVGLGRRLGANGSGNGVVANVEFLFPGRFVARALGRVTATQSGASPIDPWQIEQLTWYVLEELSAKSVVVPGANTSNMWALARRVADLFDRYATQRPRLIEHWANDQYTDGTYTATGELSPLGADHHWQVQLWQKVRQRIGTPSPPEQLPELLNGLRNGNLQPALPERVALFGLGSVPPNLLTVLRALAEVREVHLLVRHPSRAAWADSPHRLAGGLTQRAAVSVTSHVHHPLLESWGRPALETKALVAGATDIADIAHLSQTTAATTLLGALQQGLRLDSAPAPLPLIDARDTSLQVHACHGEVRQLEVLRDALGHAFVADPTLQPHDVQVLCADLERFAPLVEAVFGRGAVPVPVRVGDRSLTTDDPVGDALESVLQLVSGRATLSEVLSLVQHEPVRRRFGWSVEQVEQIAEWCSMLGTRWGLTAEHRLEWGVPEHVATGTWSAMVDRLLAGVAMSAPSPRLGFADVPPFDDMGADQVELAGTVAHMLRQLTLLQPKVGQSMPITEWAVLLHDVIDDFCAFDPAEPWRRQRVHRQVEQLVDSARRAPSDPHHPDTAESCDIPLSFAEMRSALAQVLADSPGRLSLRSGAVTVTSFVPQHGVPARVVCILGLDENSLRSGVFDGDDVLGLRPCIGERHPRFESRQLLLDAVLSARERLIITCNGADLTTNREMPLVVPLAELLDVVGRVVPLDKRHAPVVVRHPRHGFNERALQPGTLVPGATTPFTFDPAMLQAAVARRGARSAWSGPTESPWLLPPAIVQSVDLQQLIDAVTNPSKVYLRERLDVRLPDEAEDADDGLSLSVSPLAKSSLGRSLLEVYRAGDSIEEWFEAARLDGTLPPGELHRAALDEVNAEVKALVDLAESVGVPLAGGERVDVNLTLDVRNDTRTSWMPSPFSMPLTGVVSGVVRDVKPFDITVVQVQYSRQRPSHRVALALQLAALELSGGIHDWRAVLIDRGGRGAKKPAAVHLRLAGEFRERREGALRLLVAALELYLWALHDAVPLFDRTSAALANGDLDKAEGALGEDLLDQWIAALWPSLSLEQLRLDPPMSTDPEGLALFDTITGGASRAELVARWLWRTYHDVVIEGDDDADSDSGDDDPNDGGAE